MTGRGVVTDAVGTVEIFAGASGSLAASRVYSGDLTDFLATTLVRIGEEEEDIVLLAGLLKTSSDALGANFVFFLP